MSGPRSSVAKAIATAKAEALKVPPHAARHRLLLAPWRRSPRSPSAVADCAGAANRSVAGRLRRHWCCSPAIAGCLGWYGVERLKAGPVSEPPRSSRPAPRSSAAAGRLMDSAQHLQDRLSPKTLAATPGKAPRRKAPSLPRMRWMRSARGRSPRPASSPQLPFPGPRADDGPCRQARRGRQATSARPARSERQGRSKTRPRRKLQ